MEESAPSDMESSKSSPGSKGPSVADRRPFGGLEFQVSEVVGRLEAVANAPEATEEEKKPEPRKINPGDLEPEEMPMAMILKVLEDLVQQTDPNSDSEDPPLLPTDAVTRAAILSHSIWALFARLERSHKSRLGLHIANETTKWLTEIFRLTDYSAYYHQDHLDGLVRVTRMLLYHRYPRYLEDGALSFVNRLPSIYSCVASPLVVVQHLCRQLGLPLDCVRPVPVDSSGRTMDLQALERLCDEDVALGRVPLLVLGEVGALPLGRGLSLAELAPICKKRHLHLHLRGHALALPPAMGRDETYSIADSLTLTPAQWFGVPGLPTVTLYKIPEPVTANDHNAMGPVTAKIMSSSREAALAALCGLAAGDARLAALPAWACVRAAGARRLVARMENAFRAARAARAVVASADLKILSDSPGGDEPPNVGIIEAVSQASACVAFQFAPPDVERPPPYYDKLNSWLGQVLQREAEMISVEVCETDAHGVVLVYSPLEGTLLEGAQAAEMLGATLEAQLHVLHATVALREPFRERAARQPALRLVHVPGWAGLGGVRYIPMGWEGASEEDLNNLNTKLVETLRATDSAFSCGDDEDGHVCVRFGMVTADTDVDELLDLVLAAGKEVEENSKVLGDMTEMLKKGIEEAQAELERSAWQEGLLRRVPVVGRVVSWWAPPPPPTGRRLLLTHGTLQTTDDVYRYVMKKDPPTEAPARAHSPTRGQTQQKP